jgi:hypothetical protein
MQIFPVSIVYLPGALYIFYFDPSIFSYTLFVFLVGWEVISFGHAIILLTRRTLGSSNKTQRARILSTINSIHDKFYPSSPVSLQLVPL